jgi:large subunit ribosomal protein L35
MPKMKTKKIVAKRFKVTKNGKVMHRVQGARHLRRNKSKSRQRRQDKAVVVGANKYSRILKQFMQF